MNRMSRPRRAALKTVAGAALLPALGAGGALAQANPPARPKVLRYAFRVAETGFDPAQVNDLYSSNVIANIFESPLTYDFLARPARVVPNTAAAMPEISADFTTLTLRIRPGIYFQDHPAFKGARRELTAQDYVYSIKRIYDPRHKSPRVYLLESAKLLGMSEIRAAALKGAPFDYDREVDGVRALDRYTLQIRLGEPAPRFYLYLADNSFLGAVAREVCEMYDEKQLMGHPVGTGPFRLADWRRSSRIVLERNPGYRDDLYAATAPEGDERSTQIANALRGRKLPMLDRVEIYIVEENQPRWLAFLNEEHDLVDEVPYDLADIVIPGGQLAPGLRKRGIRMDRAPRANVDMALFNMEHPLVGGYTPEKVALRRAISLAYSVDEEIRLVRKGQSVPSNSPVAPTVPGFDPGFRSDMSAFSRARARALLDSFGYIDRNGDGWREQPDGSPLVLEMATQPNQQTRGFDELMKRDMDALGLRVVFRTAQWPEQYKAARAGKLTMWSVQGRASSPDGLEGLLRYNGAAKGGINLARFDHPAMNADIERLLALPDGPERDAAFREAKRLTAVWMPYKLRTHPVQVTLTQPWLVGFRRPLFWSNWFETVDLEPRARAD